MCDAWNDVIARSSAAWATVVRSSALPNAPIAMVNATEAIIAWKSDSSPESSAALAFSAAASQRADAASTQASTASRATFSACDS